MVRPAKVMRELPQRPIRTCRYGCVEVTAGYRRRHQLALTVDRRYVVGDSQIPHAGDSATLTPPPVTPGANGLASDRVWLFK